MNKEEIIRQIEMDRDCFNEMKRFCESLHGKYSMEIILSALSQNLAVMIHMSNNHKTCFRLAWLAIEDTLEEYCDKLGRGNWRKGDKTDQADSFFKRLF